MRYLGSLTNYKKCFDPDTFNTVFIQFRLSCISSAERPGNYIFLIIFTDIVSQFRMWTFLEAILAHQRPFHACHAFLAVLSVEINCYTTQFCLTSADDSRPVDHSMKFNYFNVRAGKRTYSWLSRTNGNLINRITASKRC